jgi:hypothetical protein
LNEWRTSEQDDGKQTRLCFDLARSGALTRAPKQYPKCMDNPPNADPALHRLLNRQLARPSEQEAMLTEDLDTYPLPDGDLSAAELAFQHVHFDFGDKPLLVLSGTNEQGDLPPRSGEKSSSPCWQTMQRLPRMPLKAGRSSSTAARNTSRPIILTRSCTR